MLQSRWAKIGAIGLVGLLLGGAVAGLVLWSRGSPDSLLRDGEAAYAQGTAALDSKDYSTATVRFDEANLRAEKALELLDKELQQPKERDPETANRLSEQVGRAFWLKARALRDGAHARAAADGKPVALTQDSISGERFRSFYTIPEGETRQAAIDSLDRAATRLPEDAAVQNEFLRLILMYTPTQWNLVEQVAERLLKLEPNNYRAHYQLAVFHFDQPILDAKGQEMGVTGWEKRKVDRLTKAREHIEKARQIANAPYWRTLELETRITTWFQDDYLRQRKNDKAAAEKKKLRQVLLDEKTGVLAAAKKDEKLPGLAVYDARGVLRLHLQALQQVVEDGTPGGGNRPQILEYLDAVLDVCQRLAHAEAYKSVVEEAAQAAVRALRVARPALTNPAPADLDERIDKVQALGETALARKVSEPSLYAQLALLMDRERVLANQQSKKDRSEVLDKRSGQWITDGLAAGTEAKLKPEQLTELHMLAAQRKAMRGEKPDTYEEHLKVLRAAPQPEAQALAFFLEGVAAERSGRLDKARGLLETARRLDPEDMRVSLILGNVYLALSNPAKAQICLESVAARYNEIEKLPDQDRKWMTQFMRSREELDYMLVLAHLGAAQAAINEFARDNKGKPVPADRFEGHESAVKDLIKKLQSRGPRNAAARHAYVRYLAGTGRKKDAVEQLEAARADHAENLELLQLEIGLLDNAPGKRGEPLDPKFVADADKRIREFVARTPQDPRGRLYWASWLADTGRPEAAVEYLENPANFPTRDEQHQRVLALAQLRKGDNAAGIAAMRHLPSSANVDAALVLLSPKAADRRKQLEEALARHEQQGLLYCLDGALRLSEKDYPRAADAYFQALEFTQVRSAAQTGLARAILAEAQTDPLAAQARLRRMLADAPGQSVLYLCYALVCIPTGEMGTSTDDWKTARNLATALNMWQPLAERDGADVTACLLTRAECWVLANRYDLAQNEAQTALRTNAKHPGALRLLVGLALDLGGTGSLEVARKHLDVLKQVQPDDAATVSLEGHVLEREGKPKEAVAVLEAYLGKHPDAAGVHAELDSLFQRLGEKEKEAEHAARWRKEQPDSLAAAVAAVCALTRLKQEDKARELARQAVQDRVKRATEQADKATAPEGTDPAEWDKEKKAFVEQTELGTRMEFARAFIRAGSADEAAKWTDGILEKKPDQAAALLLKGDVAMAREDWKGAAAVYDTILAKEPKNVIAMNNLAWLLADKLDDAKRAYAIVEKLRRNPVTGQPLGGDRLRPEILDTVGEIYAKLNDSATYGDMRDLFSAACVRYPADARMYLYLGIAQAKLKQPQLARTNLGKALSLAAPDISSALSPAERTKVRQDAQAALKPLTPSE